MRCWRHERRTRYDAGRHDERDACSGAAGPSPQAVEAAHRACASMTRWPASARGTAPITRGYLLRLVELELIDRERRTIERRIRAARFPSGEELSTRSSLPRSRASTRCSSWSLPRCEYVLRRENIIALGNSVHGQDACRARTRSGRLPEGLYRDVHDRGSAGQPDWKRATNAAC